MNDYWDYLEHGLLGKEQKDHKYYARIPVGKNKLGFTQYRYFYDAREYGAYVQSVKDKSAYSKFNNGNTNYKGIMPKTHTGYYTGKGKNLPTAEVREELVDRRNNNHNHDTGTTRVNGEDYDLWYSKRVKDKKIKAERSKNDRDAYIENVKTTASSIKKGVQAKTKKVINKGKKTVKFLLSEKRFVRNGHRYILENGTWVDIDV